MRYAYNSKTGVVMPLSDAALELRYNRDLVECNAEGQQLVKPGAVPAAPAAPAPGAAAGSEGSEGQSDPGKDLRLRVAKMTAQELADLADEKGIIIPPNIVKLTSVREYIAKTLEVANDA
jgi:hypothetical protein